MGPSYTVEEVIAVLIQEYEGVASSNIIFKDFYQSNQRLPPNPSLRVTPAIVITMGGPHHNGTKGQKGILFPTSKNHGLIFGKI